jgi:hypothetical protein
MTEPAPVEPVQPPESPPPRLRPTPTTDAKGPDGLAEVRKLRSESRSLRIRLRQAEGDLEGAATGLTAAHGHRQVV